jgi:electron transport complex protein RnfD
MNSNQTPLISGPHTHAPLSVSAIMFQVILALLPATVFGIYLFGWPAFNLLMISTITVLVAEAVCLWIMRKPIRLFLLDGSAIVTGWLVAFSLPPWAPWWIAVIGSLFAIVIGKQIFGGIGQNVFNPAMLARVMLLIAFPLEMTTWIEPKPLFSEHALNFTEGLAITFNGIANIDAISSASLLGYVKTQLTLGHTVPEILATIGYTPLNSFQGFTNGSFVETSAILLLIGGIYLMLVRIITWHIPVSLLATIAILATIFNYIDPNRYADAPFHILNGGMMLAAFFIATDLVTSPATPVGRIIFGIGCGTISYVIRTWGTFPEGIGFAVLLMNAVTPLIDHYTRPRIYGRTRSGQPLGAK